MVGCRRRRFLLGGQALAGLGLLSGFEQPIPPASATRERALQAPPQAPTPARRRIPVDGLLWPGKHDGPHVAALREGLRAHGQVDGRTVAIDQRSTAGDDDQYPLLAEKLARGGAGVIVTTSMRGRRPSGRSRRRP